MANVPQIEGDQAADLRLMKKAMKRHGSPEAITTDGLRNYPTALDELDCSDRQDTGCWANNAAENTHLPFLRREKAMLRFRPTKTLRKFASFHANALNHSSLERYLIDPHNYRKLRSAAPAVWQVLASEAAHRKVAAQDPAGSPMPTG